MTKGIHSRISYKGLWKLTFITIPRSAFIMHNTASLPFLVFSPLRLHFFFIRRCRVLMWKVCNFLIKFIVFEAYAGGNKIKYIATCVDGCEVIFYLTTEKKWCKGRCFTFSPFGYFEYKKNSQKSWGRKLSSENFIAKAA